MTINPVIEAAVARPATAQSQPVLPSASQNTAVASLQKSLLINQEVESANKMASRHSTTVQYRVHEASNAITVKVMDKETGQVIREIPPQKFLDMMSKLQELVGFIINEEA